MTEEYPLTAKQIKEMDEIRIDKQAIENTLRVALNYHANSMNSNLKKSNEWWKELTEIHKIDKDKEWYVDTKSLILCIKNKERGDK